MLPIFAVLTRQWFSNSHLSSNSLSHLPGFSVFYTSSETCNLPSIWISVNRNSSKLLLIWQCFSEHWIVQLDPNSFRVILCWWVGCGSMFPLLTDSWMFADEVFWNPDATRSSVDAARSNRYQPRDYVSIFILSLFSIFSLSLCMIQHAFAVCYVVLFATTRLVD